MDKNMFINKRLDNLRPKTLECVKPKKELYQCPSLNVDELNVIA